MDDIITHDIRWHELLMPTYLPRGEKDKWASKVQQCPNGLKHRSDWNSTIALNNRISGKNQSSGTSSIRSLRLATPTETCMLMDSYDVWRSTGQYNMSLDRLIEEGGEKVVARHLEKANVTMVDGSAKAWSWRVLLTKSSWDDTFWDPEQ